MILISWVKAQVNLCVVGGSNNPLSITPTTNNVTADEQ
ncbi:hypothetical protein NAB2_3111 [Lactiplantibacillus plantarum]|uniref:Uncharacterized protein n=1 Tax=Lactiplantibacillus plantarum TaxID=1590 RepID=A0AAW3RAV9_LACPN|nr:hypothetical protein NAB2_3111 [Lactiplantibacillus plantarum]